MQHWKINQRIFDALGTKKDILGVHIDNNKIIKKYDNLVNVIQQQFYDLDNIFIPAKSYCVALVYATELTKDFGGSVLDYLNDSELLLNDIYFVPYNKTPDVYNYFLTNTAWQSSPMSDRIRQYYREEIHLEGMINEI